MITPPNASLVRPAHTDDATRCGEIQAAGMLRRLAAGVGHDLPDDLASMFDPSQIAIAWHNSILEPPTAKHRVLVALDEDDVVGFVAIAPVLGETGASEGGAGETGADEAGAGEAGEAGVGEVDAEIVAFEVDAAVPADLHGSRLLNAAADVLALSQARSLRIWVVRGDDERQRFLSESGFAPLGRTRAYDVGGDQVVEDAWWATIGDPAT